MAHGSQLAGAVPIEVEFTCQIALIRILCKPGVALIGMVMVKGCGLEVESEDGETGQTCSATEKLPSSLKSIQVCKN